MKVNYSTFLNGELLTKLILDLIAINMVGMAMIKTNINYYQERQHLYLDKLKRKICK